MKRLPIGIPLFLGLAVLLGCSAEPREGSDREAAATDTAARPPAANPMIQDTPTPVQPDTTITISRVDGEIVVEPDSLAARRGRVVRWAATDAGAVWLVVFADSTPMQNGVQVLHNTRPGNPNQAPIRGDAIVGSEYKYWVFYPDGEGGYLQLDPRLVIIDN